MSLDIARKPKRYVTIDGHKYMVKPASKSVVEKSNEISEPLQAASANEGGDMTPVEVAHILIQGLALRLVPEGDAPPPDTLLTELYDTRDLIGLEELEQLADQIAGQPVVPTPR